MEHYDLSIKPIISRHGVRAARLHPSVVPLSVSPRLYLSPRRSICASFISLPAAVLPSDLDT